MNAAILFVAGALVVSELPPQRSGDPQNARAVHDRLFRSFLPGDITTLLAKSSGDINLPDPVIPPQWIHLPEPRDQMQNLVCGADLVAVVTAKAGVSRLTADEGNIYSEWQFSLNDVLKADKKAVGPRSEVTVLIRGGTLQLEGRKIRVENDEILDGFRQTGRYLLFLYRVPETGAYTTRTGFALFNDKVGRLSKHSRFLQLETMSRPALVSLARNAIAAVASIPECAQRRTLESLTGDPGADRVERGLQVGIRQSRVTSDERHKIRRPAKHLASARRPGARRPIVDQAVGNRHCLTADSTCPDRIGSRYFG